MTLQYSTPNLTFLQLNRRYSYNQPRTTPYSIPSKSKRINILVYSFVLIQISRSLVLMLRRDPNYSFEFYTFVEVLSIHSPTRWRNMSKYLHLLDNYGILCSRVRCCIYNLRHLFKVVLPRAITVGRIPLVVGKLCCCGCAVVCAMQSGAYL